MPTTLRKPFIVLVVLTALITAVVLAYIFTPPLFVQAGRHFWGGPDLFSLGGVYSCEASVENCEPVKETLLAAVARDPNFSGWWPVKIEFLRVD